MKLKILLRVKLLFLKQTVLAKTLFYNTFS